MNTSIVAQVEDCILSSYEAMYRLAYSYVRNEQDAMDIVQESAYKAIKGASSLNNPKQIKTWLWRIVINTSFDFIRKHQHEFTCEELNEPAMEDHYTDFDTLEALNTLDKRERAVIVLRFFEDQKIQKIAQILNLNTNTAKSILYRGLNKMKIKLSEGEC